MTTGIRKAWVIWLAGLLVFAAAAQATYAANASTERAGTKSSWARSLQPNTHAEEAGKALGWMRTQQQPDGSFAGFGAGSTVDAALAIVAAGQDPATYSNGGKTPVDFLRGKAAEIAKTTGGAGKLLLAVAAMGMDGTTFGGANLVESINAGYDAAAGHYGEDVIGHAFAMLGLKAAGQPVPPKAVDYLKGAQTAEGGWAFSGETKPGAADTNTTAVVMQALAASGMSETDPVMQKAEEYLWSQQNGDEGFPYQKGGEFGSDSDVNSTAYVAQALLHRGEKRGMSFILAMQKPNGAFQWKKSEPDDNAGATYQAVPAILGTTLAEPKGYAHTIAPGGGAPSPGMPTTGGGDDGATAIAAAIAALAALMLGTGLAVRRRA